MNHLYYDSATSKTNHLVVTMFLFRGRIGDKASTTFRLGGTCDEINSMDTQKLWMRSYFPWIISGKNKRDKCTNKTCHRVLYIFLNAGGNHLRIICYRNACDEKKLLTCRDTRLPVHAVCPCPWNRLSLPGSCCLPLEMCIVFWKAKELHVLQFMSSVLEDPSRIICSNFTETMKSLSWVRTGRFYVVAIFCLCELEQGNVDHA